MLSELRDIISTELDELLFGVADNENTRVFFIFTKINKKYQLLIALIWGQFRPQRVNILPCLLSSSLIFLDIFCSAGASPQNE